MREGAIVGCTVQGVSRPGGANIRFIGESAQVAHKVGLFTISGNLISSQQTQIHLRYARGIAISGNTLFSGHERNIVLEDSSNIVIGSNVFDHNPDYAPETLDGVRLVRCRGVTMSGNHFAGTRHPDGAIEVNESRDVLIGHTQILDPAACGVAVSGSRHVRIAGCSIIDARDDERYQCALRFERSRACQVSDCVLTAGRRATMHIEDSDVREQGWTIRQPGDV